MRPRPEYAREAVRLLGVDRAVLINDCQAIHASHPMRIEGDAIVFTLPEGEEGWAVLSDAALAPPTRADVDAWLAATLDYWRDAFPPASYSGPYQRELAASLRAIRLLAHEETGGILAAATTSLPEVVGGAGNWDYRYVWLRDAGMIVSALTRLDGNLAEGTRYLGFICSSHGSSSEYPVAVFTNLDGERAPQEEILPLAGYLDSQPVRIGNDAGRVSKVVEIVGWRNLRA